MGRGMWLQVDNEALNHCVISGNGSRKDLIIRKIA